MRFSIGANYQIDQHWSITAVASVARLQGDAANSPITEDKLQPAAGVFSAYRF